MFPRVKGEQVQQVREFLEEYVERFDTHVQAHIIMLKNPVVRAFASLLLHFFEPPQPYKITNDDAVADKYASECCNKPRSYKKKNYNTGHKF